jgi:hypothetical protein
MLTLLRREGEKSLASWRNAAAPGRRVRRVYEFLRTPSLGRRSRRRLDWPVDRSRFLKVDLDGTRAVGGAEIS